LTLGFAEQAIKEAFTTLARVRAMMAAADKEAGLTVEAVPILTGLTVEGEDRREEAKRLFYKENYSQRDIAQRFSVTDRTVRRWLKGK
jgi:DNA-directed RNA polymerase specialized sigma24 family protein